MAAAARMARLGASYASRAVPQGNKGAACIRMQYYDTSVCVVCSHLAAHRGNVAGRNADFKSIMERTAFIDAERAARFVSACLGGGPCVRVCPCARVRAVRREGAWLCQAHARAACART